MAAQAGLNANLVAFAGYQRNLNQSRSENFSSVR